ncbi:glycosyltransferase [Spirillospora sp. CA-294931]|uniref:glycosyltransferase n=1 Tax=Spirillospora sp. CA-294931 TaxID=3240042 RepID=UPI003D8EF7F1
MSLITFLAVGSRGDTQPYVALGRGLRARGHEVRVVCSRSYAGLVRDAGLECVPLDADIGALLASPEGQAWLAAGHNPLALARRLRTLVGPMADRHFSEIAAAAEGADYLVCSTLGLIGHSVAVAGITPYCLAGLQPSEPTGEFPTFHVPGGRSLGRLGNRASHAVVDQVGWQVFRPLAVDYRRTRTLGKPSLASPLAVLRRRRRPLIYGYSPAVVPVPGDWRPDVHVTGYWFLEPDAGWRPPDALERFLDAGPPPVYVGFGSMVPGDAGATDLLVRAALRRAGVRGLLLGDGPSDESVHVVRDVPHSWLFPRVAAVVHHGGAGTTAAALRAGVPMVATPFGADQPFWGERVAALGVGPRPVPFRELTVDALARAIKAAGDQGMRDRAGRLGRRIAAEDGIARACDVIEADMRKFHA